MDTYSVMPADTPLSGEITIPGDKSISHRAVIFGSIAEGTTTISGFLEGEDNLSTIAAFRSMGVTISSPVDGELTITGAGKDGLKKPTSVIDCGNSGTTARLLTGLLSAQGFSSTLTGDASLRGRPMKRVVEPLTLMGADISGAEGGDKLPLNIEGKKLKGITYRTPVASAQLKSALLLAGLFADGETSVIEPAKSRDHTELMLENFGVDIRLEGLKVSVSGGASLKGTRVFVPGDISSAAFFIVAALITKNSEILIKNICINPTRYGIIDILKLMGADITLEDTVASKVGEPVASLRVKSSKLKGIDIDGSLLLPAIDEFPIICVVALFADGETTISGAGELRVKESDRIAVMAEELTKIGAEVEERPDGILIQGRGNHNPVYGGLTDSHGDHRVAMALAVSALLSKKGIKIKDASCVDVSFPGFFDLLERVRNK
ncbi:MAG: 3-phosphoshikimate 1-carboxyvinyltransferase [Deltaproteobacteria bacterium]|nr:3-phosphoshikimate 1-carboxyvinyltransferase [Deltaproteobacteria bacterium]